MCDVKNLLIDEELMEFLCDVSIFLEMIKKYTNWIGEQYNSNTLPPSQKYYRFKHKKFGQWLYMYQFILVTV